MQSEALRLSEITISNLRSIRRETFPLSHFTALIGYNNAGKTNILMGILWLLSHFTLNISFFDDAKIPVEVEGLFEGISEVVLDRLGEEKAAAITPYLMHGALRVKNPTYSWRFERKYRDDGICASSKALSATCMEYASVDFVRSFERLFPEPIAIWDFEGNQAFTKLLMRYSSP